MEDLLQLSDMSASALSQVGFPVPRIYVVTAVPHPETHSMVTGTVMWMTKELQIACWSAKKDFQLKVHIW